MKLRILDVVLDEVAAAAAWYDSQQFGLGESFRREFDRRIDEIADDPRQFSRVEFAPVRGEVRRVLLRRFPYLVVYKILRDEILVMACGYAGRGPDYWRTRPGI
jgi:toxin ParE1/3/4